MMKVDLSGLRNGSDGTLPRANSCWWAINGLSYSSDLGWDQSDRDRITYCFLHLKTALVATLGQG